MIQHTLHTSPGFFIMDATNYWPFAREYSIWNTAVAALQFWMADLKLPTLGNSTEWVYTVFCSNSAQQFWNISEEVLFGHFMTTFNDAFEWELTLEDIGYESGSESLNIPTPLCRTPCLYHISAENLSFNPTTTLSTVHPHQAHAPQKHRSHSSVCCILTFSNNENPLTDSRPLHGPTEQSSPLEQQMVCHHTDDSFQEATNEGKEEVFPTTPLDDDVWLEEPVPDRHFASMNSHNCMTSALILTHTAWISYTPLQKMHHHHIMRW